MKKNFMKEVIMFVLIAVMVLLPVISNAAFPDVPTGHWAESYINELTSKGIINGYTDGRYGPSDTLTYGQFLKLIVTASLEGVDFDLVSGNFDHWAAPYLKVAENYSVLDEGKINKDNIDKPISRIDVVYILGLCDINMRDSSQKTADDMEFNDIEEIDSMEEAMLSHAVGSGVINGYEDGTFKPNNNLTRAEAAKILSVYLNNEG